MSDSQIHSAVDVSAIIISLNSKHYLEGCIDTWKQSDWGSIRHEIIVVDNGSTDGSLELLQERYPEVRVIANEKNVGFCPAGNQGAEAAYGKYLFFLNDDILIEPDAVPKLVTWMDAHPEAGMIGSRLFNIDGTDQFSSGRSWPSPMNALFARKSPLTKWFPNAPWAKRYLLSQNINGTEPYEVDWLSAAAMMVRKEAFLAAGKLAEDFYYFHELVFCDRAKRAGWPVYLHPQSKIFHYEGAGSGIRTRRVRIRHIERFHIAAYHWYTLHHRMHALNPVRLPLAAVLWFRAVVLIGSEYLKPDAPPASVQSPESRPEGGVAI